MIKINTDEFDRLLEVFIRLKADSDNLLGKTSMLRNEMLNDPEFTEYPKNESIIAILDRSINSLNELNEDIRNLNGIFINAKDSFETNENELVTAIGEISNRLDSIMAQLDATMNSNQIVVVDESEEMRPVNEVERLVAGSLTDIEATNIAVMTKLAKSKAEVKKIEGK